MAGNTGLILAGISASGSAGNSLAYFAPYGTPGPTDAATAPPTGFQDAGWISEKGLTAKVKESSKALKGYGSLAPLRTIVTESDTTFDVDFLESNPTSLAVYHRKALSSITATAGAIAFSTGQAGQPDYAAVFDLVDGTNLLRAYAPHVQVTDRGDVNIASGEAVDYPVVLTAYPDSTGAAIYWHYLLNALVPPTVTSLSPATGLAAGGTTVTFTGTHFTGATAVHFDTDAATSFTVASDTSIVAVAPAHTAAAVDVSVTTPAGTGTKATAYTYT